MRQVIFITGTDTGVGKTVAGCLLARFLRDAGWQAAALKPVCSGEREDAEAYHTALSGTMSLDEINPWHFRAPLTPLLAARRENKKLRLAEVTRHVRAAGKQFPIVLVEGAGGLLSPLGEDFDSRDIIVALEATPLVVTANRLGALNQSLLVLAALPARIAKRAQLVLVSPRRPNVVARTNLHFLRELLGRERVHSLPWIRAARQPHNALAIATVRRATKLIARGLGLA